MARKNKNGRFVLSAGEIGIYTVCPEAWRLRMLTNASREVNGNIKIGSDLHQEWTTKHEEVAFFKKGIRTILFLIALAVLLTLLLVNNQTLG